MYDHHQKSNVDMSVLVIVLYTLTYLSTLGANT